MLGDKDAYIIFVCIGIIIGLIVFLHYWLKKW